MDELSRLREWVDALRAELEHARAVLQGTEARGECHPNWIETALRPAVARIAAVLGHGVHLCGGYEPHPFALYDYCVASVYVEGRPRYCGHTHAEHDPALPTSEKERG